MIRLKVTMHVQASASHVYAWWTDFTENDSQLSGRILRSRANLRRRGDVVTFEDEGRMLGIRYRDHVEVRLFPPNRWIAHYHSTRFKASSTYVVEAEAKGSRLTVDTEVKFRGLLRLFAPLVKGLIEHRIAREWADYRDLMEREVGHTGRTGAER
jgi:hypothetical protein